MNAPTAPRGRRYLIQGGIVLTLDPRIGNLQKGDVLVEDGRIAAVGVDLEAGDSEVIAATGRIVMPGFVDTHHHMFETALRGWLSNAILFNDGTPEGQANYMDRVIATMTGLYTPDDVYISDLLGALSQLDAGVTSVLDVSQIHHTPEHTEAAISAFTHAGQRCIMAYLGNHRQREARERDIVRLKSAHFASREQLLTLAILGEVFLPDHRDNWEIARAHDAPIVCHMVGSLGLADTLERLGHDGCIRDDNLFIHMTGISDAGWRYVRDAGAAVSLAIPIEQMMRHGEPPILKMLSLGLEPSLSTDVECTLCADLFTQMRGALSLQRGLINELAPAQRRGGPQLLTSHDVIRYAITRGAQHLRLDDRIGSLSPGKRADLILLETRAANTAPLNNVAGAVATLMDRSNVETVIVDGIVRKWQGRLLGVDLPALAARIEASAAGLFERAKIPRDLFA